MEKIPGFEDAKYFPDYISAIYKFGLWAIGIAALLMISVGGFMYFTSAGNTANLEKAKAVIRDAIIGVIAVMVAWLLLYVINPDLVGGSLSSIENMSTSDGSLSGQDITIDGYPQPSRGTSNRKFDGIVVIKVVSSVKEIKSIEIKKITNSIDFDYVVDLDKKTVSVISKTSNPPVGSYSFEIEVTYIDKDDDNEKIVTQSILFSITDP
ncbi:MAG TPA: hypothetical protein ENH35_03190 [Candidatus Moranbacteria bacterium]|nr:hypothetical protein [Candidatus Moranbacteria bacterium]